MRYELTDYEWAAIRPMLPNKPRGTPRVNDRRVLNGIFWVLRSGAPWRDLPDIRLNLGRWRSSLCFWRCEVARMAQADMPRVMTNVRFGRGRADIKRMLRTTYSIAYRLPAGSLA
jgi:transposase